MSSPTAKKKYLTAEKQLTELVSRLEDGNKLPTFRSLMKNLQVSQSTLDHALSRLEKGNLIIKKQGSGIYVSKPVNGLKRRIGVVVSDLADRFAVHFLKGIEEVLDRHGYRSMLCHGHEDLQRELEILESFKNDIDGLIIYPIHENILNPEYIKYFQDLKKKNAQPITFIESNLLDLSESYIGFNQFEAFRETVKKLAGTNSDAHFTALGFLGSYIGTERLYGFKSGLREAGIPKEKVEIINIDMEFPSNEIPWQQIFSRNEQTFLFIFSPLLLPQFGIHYFERKLDPAKVILISVVEEDYLDYINFPVIALKKPAVELGRKAALTTINSIHGVKPEGAIRLDLTLEVPEIYKSII